MDALESAGVIFVEENGDGPGVRLRKPAPPAPRHTEPAARTDAPAQKAPSSAYLRALAMHESKASKPRKPK
jgi:hypothetical protein